MNDEHVLMRARTSAPRVLVLPGLGASDASTMVLRAALVGRGLQVHRWNLGLNLGPGEKLMVALEARFLDLVERSGEPIALVGWSMGGQYALRLADIAPERVRAVVTLGSPLGHGDSRPSLEVPTTSIYSRNDGVVPWRLSTIDDRSPRHENVEVRTPHHLLCFDPAVLHAVYDRVRCDPHQWQPFEPPRFMRPAYATRAGVAGTFARR